MDGFHKSFDKNFNALQKDSASLYRFCVITARWNADITDALTQSCINTLKSHGATEQNILTLTVPGSYELGQTANLVLHKDLADAVICLGCIIQGETNHDRIIADAISRSLLDCSLHYQKPVIFGVLTTHNIEQAIARSNGTHGNKGEESALAAIEMCLQFSQLNNIL